MVLIFFQFGVAVCVLLMSIVFDMAIGNKLNLYVTLTLYFSEGLVVGAPVWFLRGRWRRVVPLLVVLVGLFMLGNVMYYRYWGDLLPWSLLADAANYNSFVFDAIPGLFKLYDFVFIVLPVMLVWLYYVLGVSAAPAQSWKMSLPFYWGSILIYLLAQSLSVVAALRYYRHANEDSSFGQVVRHKLSTLSNSRLYEWHGNGLLLYTYIQLTRQSGAIDSLCDSQICQINDFRRKLGRYTYSNSAFAADNGKNLILIIVESLNSWVIGKTVGGHSLTPTLDSLLDAPGTVSCLTVAPQRRHGGSSDGHFMYNTGLLPISYGSAAMLFAENDYAAVSMSRHFAESVDFIVENGSVWNHRATTAAYGYDRLVEQIDVGSTPIDSTLFAIAVDTIEHLRDPFLAEIITLGMHYPFVDVNLDVPHWLKNYESGDTDMKNYLCAVYGFDVALGNFIKRIKDNGIFDSSVIVIVSDHDLGVGRRKADGKITFVAVNTGLTETITRKVGQIDVYPTICSIMGFDDGWQGVGMSMLDSRNSASVLPDGEVRGSADADVIELKRCAWEMSDLMVRSDYFRNER